MHSISVGENVTKKKVAQKALMESVANWSPLIRLGPEFSSFYEDYKKRSDDIAIYYDHGTAEQKFHSRFYFDIGFILNKKYAKANKATGDLELVDFTGFQGFSKYIPSSYYPNDKSKITLAKNSQGYATISQKYKIIWAKVYSKKFYFTDRQVLPSMSNAQMICSDNEQELLYLFSLLNSAVNKYVFQRLFQLQNEQYGTFLVIRRIKEFLRVPKITKANYAVKDEITRRTAEMLDMEEKTLSDFVDFSGVLVQRFDDVQVAGDTLVLIHANRKTELQIKGDTGLIASTIAKEFGAEGLKLGTRQIALSELRNLQVIDSEKQAKLKDYIDDLVFALYFNIKIDNPSLDKASAIHKLCSVSDYYPLQN